MRTPGKSAAKPRPGVLFVLFTECRTAYFPKPSVARGEAPAGNTFPSSGARKLAGPFPSDRSRRQAPHYGLPRPLWTPFNCRPGRGSQAAPSSLGHARQVRAPLLSRLERKYTGGFPPNRLRAPVRPGAFFFGILPFPPREPP